MHGCKISLLIFKGLRGGFILNLYQLGMKAVLVIIVLVSLLQTHCATEKLALNTWNMQIQGDPGLYRVSTPATLSTHLLQLKKIPENQYYRDNFLAFYAYQTKNVNYSTTFAAPSYAQSSSYTSYLVFEGLDTHCDVYLNGKLVLSAHNMFRRFRVGVTGLLGNNSLELRFMSSARYDQMREKEFYDEYGFNLPQNYSFTRKAAYQYGWDWGPRILTLGIWKQSYIEFGSHFHFTDPILIPTTPITQKHPTFLRFNVSFYIREINPMSYNISATIKKDGETIVFPPNSYYISNEQAFNWPCVIYKDNAKNVSKFVWWTWDLGEPNLFDFTLTLSNGMTDYVRTIRTGLRSVTVSQQKDTFGSEFTIALNGQPLFIRGGNYIPPEMSLSSIPLQTYTRIKNDSLFAKFNMLRIWGGGQFENDEFYSTMDEAGILIWHDLMFACALYPVTPAGGEAENVRKEMEDNLYRIGYHPSIGLWNGNNQVWIGWQEWGWKKGLEKLQILEVQKMYHKIFSQVLPSVINAITPHIFYWQTSPSSSSNQPSTIGSGDIHFWRVWGGGTPIEEYQIYVGRFNSEYGMQSMPEYSSIIKFTAPQDRVIDSYILRLHERHIYGDKYLPMYTTRYAGSTPNLQRYSYYTQVMQAYALELAIVSLRGNKPYCMGSIYWQLNDVWPVSSWATVDYYGMYKAAHYRVRQLHGQMFVHVVHVPKGDSDEVFRVVAVNQYDKRVSLFVMVRVMDFNGTVLRSYQVEKTAAQFENIVLARLNISNDINRTRSLIAVEARSPDLGQQILSNIYYFVPPAERTILAPRLQVTKKGSLIQIKANSLASYVWIRSKNQAEGFNFEKNYFDLLAGAEISVDLGKVDSEKVEVTCYQSQRMKDMAEMKEKIKVVPE